MGLLQGLTEFFPVSSSGHLVLVQDFLNVDQAGLSFEILLHLGSLLAVLLYFSDKLSLLIKSLYKEEHKQYRPIILFLFVGTLPAVFVGLFFKSSIESAFGSPTFTSAMLIVTGIILFSTRYKTSAQRKLTAMFALLIGIGQAMAILPGISRSGTTISVGMFLGIKPEEAAEFSFLLSIPAILGAVVLNLKDLIAIDYQLIPIQLTGMAFSFASSLLAVFLVMKVIKKGKFEYFAYYCVAVGLLGLYLSS